MPQLPWIVVFWRQKPRGPHKETSSPEEAMVVVFLLLPVETDKLEAVVKPSAGQSLEMIGRSRRREISQNKACPLGETRGPRDGETHGDALRFKAHSAGCSPLVKLMRILSG
ncbi:hypothetical protein J3459_012535 [Metarhizium acridum]|nr:hypothetical protein J3459_012535 [Metarhizium acridum]